MTTLSDLAHFRVDQIEVTLGGAVLRGSFNHLRGVREARSWLYAGTQHSLIGDLTHLNAANRAATFAAPFWESTSQVQIGSAVPWIDGYWQPSQIAMIVDADSNWRRVRFVSRAAQFFFLDGVRGCGPLEQSLPEGAEATYVDPAGWDHEHCEIWGETIGAGGDAFGYVDAQDHWLCEACFSAYAAQRDLAFVIADL